MPDQQTPRTQDRTSEMDTPSLWWHTEAPNESLAQFIRYVENGAMSAIAWYWRNKRWKARCSRLIQILVIVLTALAGIFPVAAYLLKEMKWPYPSESGLWASLFVGVAAALIGADRAFGISSGWTRYVLTATAIQKMLEEFRLDCVLLLCKAGQDSGQQISTVVGRAKEFRLAVEQAVLQETKDWATEFQNNIAQLEKDVKAQVDLLKGELEKARLAASTAGPGAIELSIQLSHPPDDNRLALSLEGKEGKVAEESIVGEQKWVRIGITPGQYRLAVRGTRDGRPLGSSTALIVKAGEVTNATISL